MTQQRKSSIGNRRPFRAQTRFLVAAISGCFVSGAIADPASFTVVNGTAVAVQAGKVLTITNSAGAILNWNKFGVAVGDTTHFQQTSASSAVLNRVLAGAPISEIYGTLSSNGRVWLINPSGILVGASGRVDTAGFVASTLGVTNSDFLAGRLSFGSSEGNPAGVGNVVNQGAITTSSGGSVYLIAPNVTNQGIITTPQGETILAAGQTVQLIDTATPGVKVEITGAEGNATNLGDIVADAGRIGIAGVMVRNSGNLNASSVVSDGGRVFLKASQDAYVDGAGRIVTTGTKGGSVEVLGNRVAVMDSASIDASGTNGGGSIKVGGDYQGKNPDVQNSMTTYFGQDASLRVDATSVGAGGTVIVWSNDTTQAHGSISAQGGANGGDGGLVETSGHNLDVNGVRVNAGATGGRAGTWLLDPSDITIVTGTAGLNQIDQATINTGLLTNNVTVETNSGSGGLGDITVNSGVVIGPGTNTNSPILTLDAARDIKIGDGTGFVRIGGTNTNKLGITLTATGNIDIKQAVLETNGANLTFASTTGNITLTSSTGNGAIVSTAGCALMAGNVCRNQSFNFVQGGLQTLTANNGTIKIEAPVAGGFGVALFSGGGQTITANNVEVRGGLMSNAGYGGNDAWITNRSSSAGQTISAHTILLQAGGQNSTLSTDRDNDAGIYSSAGLQTINITGTGGSLTLNGGAGGHNNAAAIYANSGGQVLNVHGAVSINGGNANGTYQNFAEISSSADQTINIYDGGSITINGGAGDGYGLDQFFNTTTQQYESVPNTEKSSNFARIQQKGGSSNSQTINFVNGGALFVIGGSNGNDNSAEVSAAYGQTINGNPTVLIRGGASGGAARLAESPNDNIQGHERSNFAGIFAGEEDSANTSWSTMTLSSLTIEGGGNTASFGGAGVEGNNLNLTVHGDVTLTGGNSFTTDSGDNVPNSTSAAHLGVGDNGGRHLIMQVDGDLILNGGQGSSGLAFVGTGGSAILNLKVDGNLTLDATHNGSNAIVGIGSLFGQATGAILVGETANVTANYGGIAVIGSNLGPMLGIPHPPDITPPPVLSGGDIAITGGLAIDAGAASGSAVSLNARSGKISLSGARVGGSAAYGFEINLHAAGDILITNSTLETNGADMTIDTGNNFTLTATTGNGSIASTAGCAFVPTTSCRPTDPPFSYVEGGVQTINATGTVKVEANANGGFGVALFSGGGQSITADRVEVLGGVSGPNNDAYITNRSPYNQEITAHTIVLKAGGTANTDENNDAVIYSSAGAQFITVTGSVGNLGSLAIYGGAAGHGNTAGIVSTSGAQNLDVVGNILVQGGGNAASYQNFAGIENNASQTINVYYGGSVVLRGGAGGGIISATGTSDNYASIKTTSGNQTIDFDDGGRLDLFGGSLGNANYARIWNSGAGQQTIAGNSAITMTGGDSGGMGLAAGATDPFSSGGFAPARGNNAMIAAGQAFINPDPDGAGPLFSDNQVNPVGWVKGTQDISASSITINGSSRAATATGNGAAGLFSAYGQTVNVVGAVQLLGGNATNVATPNASASRTRLWSMGGIQSITAKQLHVIGAATGTNNIATVGSWGNQIITLGANGTEGPALLLQTNGSGSTNVLNNSLSGTQTINFTGQQAVLRVEGSFASLGTNSNVANTAHAKQVISFSPASGGSIEVIGVGRPLQDINGNGFIDDGEIPRANIQSSGDQTITGATSITLTASNSSNGRALIIAQGDQHIETNQLSLTGGGGNASDSYAAIEHGVKDNQGMVTGWGEQHIVLTGANAAVTLRGGSGNGFNTNSQESGNFAEIKNRVDDPNTDFDQHIEFLQAGGKISIYGGSVGSSNGAGIGSNYGQKISGDPIVLLQGAASGGAADLVNQYGGNERSNDAGIFGGDDEDTDHSVSNLSFASLTIIGGAGTNTFSKAGVGGDDVTLTVHGNVMLTGGQGTLTDPNNDVPNSVTGAFIYHDDHGSLNVTIDGNLVINGGSGSSGIALIGAGGAANVNLKVGGDLTATAGAGAVTIGSLAGQSDPIAFPKAVAYGGGTSVSVAANSITLNAGLAGSGGVVVGSGNNQILFNGDGGNHMPMDIGTGPVDVELIAARNLTINGQTSGVVIGTKVLGTPASSVPIFELDEFGNPTSTQTYFPPADPGSQVNLVAGARFASGGDRQLVASLYGGNISTLGAVTIRTDNFSPSAEIHLTAITSNTNTSGDVSLGNGTLLDGDVVHVNSAGDFSLSGQSTGTQEFAARAGWNALSGQQSARGGNISINYVGEGTAIYDVIGIELKAFAGTVDSSKGNINIGGPLRTGSVGGVGVYADRDLTLSSRIDNYGEERTVHLQAGLVDNSSHGGNVAILYGGAVNVFNGGSLHVVARGNGDPAKGKISFDAGSTVYSSNEVALTADTKVTLNGFVETENLFHVSAGSDIAMGTSGEISSGDAELYANGNIQIDGLINASDSIEIETGDVGASQGNITLGESSRLYSDRVTIRAEGDLTASGWIENGSGFDTYVHLSAGDGGEGASARGGKVWLTQTSKTHAYGGITISANAGSVAGSGTVTHDGEMSSEYYSEGFVSIYADRNININGKITDESDQYDRGIRLQAGSDKTASLGGNIVLGIGADLVANYIYADALAGSEASTGNISQAGGKIDANQFVSITADRDVTLNGSVGHVGSYGYSNTDVQITAGVSRWRGGIHSETSLGGNILLEANSSITGADVDLRTNRPTGAATFTSGNVTQVLGGEIAVTYVTSLHVQAAGNVDLLGSLDVPNSGVYIYAGYNNTCSECTNAQVYEGKHITISDLNSQNTSVTLSATGPITAAIDGANQVTASIENSSTGGISITSSGENTPNLTLVDHATANRSVTYTRAEGDLVVTDRLRLDAGSTGTVGFVAHDGDLNWNATNVYGGSLSLGASGAITQATLINVASLSTSSGSGTDLTDDNVVSKYSGSNSGTGAISVVSGNSLELGNINNAQSVTIASLGAISQTGIITADSLATASQTGTTLTANNMVAKYSGANSGTGNIAFNSANGGGLRLVELILQNQALGGAVQNAAAAGDINITSTGGGNLSLDAAVVSSHAVNLNSAGGIVQTAAITSPTLSTTSVSGTELTQDNLVGTFTGNNSAAGNVNFKSASASGLVVAGVSNTAAAAGNVSITSAGPLTISGNASSAHNLSLASTGAIAATANLTALGLSSTSAGGAAFTGANQVKTINTLNNTGSGNVVFNNTAAPLTIAQLNNSGGNVTVSNTGGIVISGAMNALGKVDVTAHSPITVTNTGAVTAGTGIFLMASAATPTSSGDSLVVSGSLSSTGGIIELVGGTVILGATSQVSATNGGSVEVAAIGAQGDIFQHGGTISSSSDVSLIADRNVSLNGITNAGGLLGVFAGLNSVGTTGGNISVGAAGNVVADDIFMIANRDTGTGSFTTGNVSQQVGSSMQTGNDFLIHASGNIDMLGTVVGNAAGRTNLLAGYNNNGNGTEQAFTGARVTANNLQANGGSVSIQATAGINAVVQSAGVVGANINNSAAGGLSLTSYGASALVLVDNSVANSAVNLDYRNAALTLGANSALVTGSGAGKVNVTANGGNLIYSGANISANGVRFSSTGNISQTAPITTNVLYTSSYGGTALSLDNVVGTYSGMNSGSGNLVFKSIKAGGLTLAGATSVAVQNLAATGDINITSTSSGPLTISGGVSGLGNISLSSAGAISALANLTAVGLNSVSVGGANYSGANHFSNVTSLTNTGSGNVVFNNTAAPLTIAKMTNTGGNITVDNVGKVVISGEMNATGTLSVTAHSPLTVASTGSVTAAGNLSLVAASTSAASTIDLLTIDGPVLSSAGNIALFGGSGIVVTKAVTATTGNAKAESPYGDITQTPDKLITAPRGTVDVSAFGSRPKDPVVIPSDTIPDPDPVSDLPKVEVITSLVTTTGSTNSNLGGDSTGGTAGTFGGAASSDEKKEEEKKDANGKTTSGEEKPAAQRSVGTCT